MEYRTLGRTGVKVSAISLGSWTFGGSVPEEEASRIFAAALDSGINFIDTANMYGENAGSSETIIGRALRQTGGRERLVLATKVYFDVGKQDPNGRGVSRYHIMRECENSLRRLQTDHIDLYYLHRLDPDIPIDETLRALDDLVRAGKVRYIGCSTAPAWSVVEALWVSKELGLNRFVAETPPYNLADRRIERELIPMARTFGLAINAYAPLASGLLTGTYRAGAPMPGGSRGAHPLYAATIRQRFTTGVQPIVDTLDKLARAKNCTIAQLALAWVLAQPGVTSAVVGVDHIAELPENLGALDVKLGVDDFAALDATAPPGEGVSSFYPPPRDPRLFGPHPFRI